MEFIELQTVCIMWTYIVAPCCFKGYCRFTPQNWQTTWTTTVFKQTLKETQVNIFNRKISIETIYQPCLTLTCSSLRVLGVLVSHHPTALSSLCVALCRGLPQTITHSSTTGQTWARTPIAAFTASRRPMMPIIGAVIRPVTHAANARSSAT